MEHSESLSPNASKSLHLWRISLSRPHTSNLVSGSKNRTEASPGNSLNEGALSVSSKLRRCYYRNSTREPVRPLTCVTLFRHHAPILLWRVQFHCTIMEVLSCAAWRWSLHEFVMADPVNPVNMLMKMNIGEAEGARESSR